MEDIKKAIAPTLELLKQLNVKVKNNEVEPDFIVKLATTMKVSAIKLDQYVKLNKLKLNGGVEYKQIEEEDDEDED
jgi:hypothetical protein